MLKFIKKLFVVVVILLGGIYFAKDYIVKKVLETKLSEINGRDVVIRDVDVSPFSKNIILRDMTFASTLDDDKNFISIGEFEADYDYFYSDKKIFISKANIKNLDFMTSKGKKVEKVSDTISPQKEKHIREFENLFSKNIDVNKMLFDDLMKKRYENTKNKLVIQTKIWNKKIDELHEAREYRVLKYIYRKFKEEKNPFVLLKDKKKVDAAIWAYKSLSYKIKRDKQSIKQNFDNILKSDAINSNLEQAVNETIGNGKDFVANFDNIANTYLNDIYQENIDKFMDKYRNFMKEIELRRNADAKENSKWEIFAEEINVSTQIYAINLSGKINNLSTRLSKNIGNIPFTLTATSSKSDGVLTGYLNIQNLVANANIKISRFDFSDLKDFQLLQKYVAGGVAKLDKDITFTADDIKLQGAVDVKDLKLNSQNIVKELDIKNLILKDIMIPLLSEINSLKLNYNYNDNKLTLTSNISKEVLDAFKSNTSVVRKSILKDILDSSQTSVKNYKTMLDTSTDNIEKTLFEKLESQNEYYDKVENILNRYNIKR